MRQSKEIMQNRTSLRNFGIYFCVIFRCHDQSLFLEGRLDTRLWFHPNLIFFQYLLVSEDPKPYVWGNLYTKFIILEIKSPFTLGKLHYTKMLHFLLYYFRECRKFFSFALFVFIVDSKFLSSSILAKKKTVLMKNTPPVEGFQMLLFDQNPKCKITFKEHCCILNFSGTCSVYICIKMFRETLNLLKSQSIEVWKKLGWVITKKSYNDRTKKLQYLVPRNFCLLSAESFPVRDPGQKALIWPILRFS